MNFVPCTCYLLLSDPHGVVQGPKHDKIGFSIESYDHLQTAMIFQKILKVSNAAKFVNVLSKLFPNSVHIKDLLQ